MQEKVESFLSKCEHEKKLANEKYRWLVQEYAGLLNEEEGYVEVSKEDWEKYKNTESLPTQYVHGKYYVTKKLPIKMTDEEFAAVEKAIPEKVLKGLKQETTGTNKDQDWPYIILLTIACLIWTAGLIISISASLLFSGLIDETFHPSAVKLPMPVRQKHPMFSDLQDPMFRISRIIVVVSSHAGISVQPTHRSFAVSEVQEIIRILIRFLQPLHRSSGAMVI